MQSVNQQCKLFVGCVSRNTIDSTIEYANENNITLGLIPSRRQVDYDGGYVGFDSKRLHNYVRERSSNVIIERDHGGPLQGYEKDDGFSSFADDCFYYDIIHIDPWKAVKNFDSGCVLTAQYMKYCLGKNPNMKFEVGTEQSIFKYEADELDYLLGYLEGFFSKNQFSQILFAVIQSGTSLKENQNTGTYGIQRLSEMVEVCKKRGIWSKEHNGDYLPTQLVSEKFKAGLDSINIAPEFGQIETQTYLNEIKELDLFDKYFTICYNSKRWEKWVDKSFDPFQNKEKLINICGHYVLSQTDFLSEVKAKVRPDIDVVINEALTHRLDELCKVI
jgi:hypothetical protein